MSRDDKDRKMLEALLDSFSESIRRRKGHGIPVMVSTTLPRELLQPFLQLLRTFDTDNQLDSAIAVLGGIDKDELMAIFDALEPGFPYREEWKL